MEFENKKEKNIGISMLKKAICVFMTVLMLLGSFGGAMGVFAMEATEYFDSKQIVSVSYESVDPYIMEGTNGYEFMNQFYDEDSGTYYTETFYHYNFNYKTGDTVTLTMGDGSTVTYTYGLNEEQYSNDFFNENGETLGNYYTSSDQYENPWTIGVNYYKFHVDGVSCDVPFTVIKNPVERVEFTPVNEDKYVYFENVGGEWKTTDIYDENGECIGEDTYYLYYTYNPSVGDTITLYMNDDSTVEYVYGEYYNEEYEGWYNGFCNEEAGVLDCEMTNYQEGKHWTVGGEYNYIELYISDYGCKTIIPVTVEVNPVVSAEFTPAEPERYSYMENTGGRFDNRSVYDENGDWLREEEFYCYQDLDTREGDKVTLYLNDDTSVDYVFEWRYNEEYDSTYGNFWNGDEKLDVSFYSNQYDKPWVLGDDNYVEIRIEKYGYTIEYPITIYENPVASITFTPADSDRFTYIENVNGCWEHNGYYDENDEWVNDKYFSYYYDEFDDGDILTVTMKDGTKVDYTCSYNEYDEYAFFDEDGNQIDFYGYSEQQENHWKIGGEHNYIIYTAFGCEYKQPVTIVPNPAKSIVYTPANPEDYIFTENLDGYMSSREYENEDGECEYEEYFRYSYNVTSADDIITVNMKDGTSVDYTYRYDEDYDEWGFFSADGEYLDWSWSDRQSENPWKIDGEHNYIIYTAYGYEYKQPVTIVPNPVESIEYAPADTGRFTFTENAGGDYRTDGDDEEFYCYPTPSFAEDDTLTVYMTDGSSVVYTCCYDENDDCIFYSEDGDSFDADDAINIDGRQYENHWTLGSENNVYYTYYGKTCTYPVTIVANPVESIVFTPAEDYVLTENKNGEWEWCSCEDEDGWYEELIFYYYIPDFNDGDKITVNYVGGTSVDYICSYYSEYDWSFCDENGQTIEVNCSSYQSDNPWKIGGEHNYFYVEYMGRTDTVPVTVISNPVESISFTAANADNYTLTYGIDGEKSYRGAYDDNDEWYQEEYFYFYSPDFAEGDKITLHLNDGRDVDYVYYRGWNEDVYLDGFYNSDGEKVEWHRYINQEENSWTVDGEYNYMILSCEGRECKIPVTILPNPVKSISFEAAEKQVFVEGISDGYYTESDKTGEEYYYYDSFGYNEGDKLTVNYKDGTTSVYTYCYNDYYDEANFYNDKGEYIYVRCYSDQDSTPWTPGNGENNYYYIEFAEQIQKVPVTVKANPVTDIEFTPAYGYILTEGLSDGDYEYDDETGDKFYYYSVPKFAEGDKLTVTRANGKTTDYYYTISDEGNYFIDADGVGIYPNRYHNQYSNHWVEGGKHNYFYISYAGYDQKVPVTVKASHVESVSFEPVSEIVLTEGLSGGYMKWDDETEEYYYYFYQPDFRLGDKIIVTFDNGTEKAFTYKGYDEYNDEDIFLSDDGQRIYIYCDNEQYYDHWLPGKDNYFTIYVADAYVDVKVAVVPSPVEEVYFTPAKPELYVLTEELSNGYYRWMYDENDEPTERYYYYYSPDFIAGDKITMVIDGERVDYIYSEKEGGFNSGDDWLFYLPTSDQYEKHWYADGEEKYFYMEIAGKTCILPVEIVPNNITDVTFTVAAPCVVIENLSAGYYAEDWYVDENGIECRGDDWYYYYIPTNRIGDKLTLTYNDGTTEDYIYQLYGNEYVGGRDFINAEGELLGVTYESNQDEKHWTPGGENYFTITCAGYEMKVPVTVKEKFEIDSVSFTPISEKILSEKTHPGYYRYAETTDEETGEIFYKKIYRYYSEELLTQGDKLTLHKADGTTVEAVYDERMGFILSDGTLIYAETDDNQYEHPWVAGGKYNYLEIYVGESDYRKSCKAYVTIIESGCVHEYENHAAKAPTCTAKGWEAYTTCKKCDYTTYKEIPATGHSYTSKVTKNATCTAKGVITYTCSCNKSYTEDIPATGKHTAVTDKGTPATYKKAGKTDGSHCSVCGTVLTKQTAIAKLKLGKTAGLKASKMTLAKSSTVTLAWNKVDGAEKYEVYQQNGKKWKKVGTTTKTSLIIKKLTAGKSYKFKVRATLKGESAGAYSSVLTVSLTPAKTTLTLKAGKKQLTANWKTVSGATGYEVQYSTAKNFKKNTKTVTVNKAKTKKTTIKKLTKGKKYFVRVRAYKTVNGKKIYGSWSSVKNVKVK